MFGDWKGHGVDIEKTRLRHVARLSHLTFAIALWYLWHLTAGSRAIKNGQRHLVDRKDRRDLSIFRLGLSTLDRCFAYRTAYTAHLIPYF